MKEGTRMWTEEEMKLFTNSTDQEIAELTGRNVLAVYAKRKYMHNQEVVKSRNQPWSSKETELLVKHSSNVEVARLTGRTVGAVTTKRQSLRTTTRIAAAPVTPRYQNVKIQSKDNTVFFVCRLGTFEVNPSIHCGVIISDDGITFKPRK